LKQLNTQTLCSEVSLPETRKSGLQSYKKVEARGGEANEIWENSRKLLKDRSTNMTPEYRKIVDEIYVALQNLNAPPPLLGIIGSWGDTLTDKEVLAALKFWNSDVRQLA
jgi:hypothetical protein